MDISTSKNKLDSNGLILIPNAIDLQELARLHEMYDASWSEIKPKLAMLDWKRMRFNSGVQSQTGFFGKNIYDGKLVASYPSSCGNDNSDYCGCKSSQIINMGNGRYDFVHGFSGLQLDSEPVNVIMKAMLCGEYESYMGALPMLEADNAGASESSNGIWHRDAYSLFDDESIDLVLKPFYYTVLIPLDDVHESSGRTTEFILGSHKVNLILNHVRNTDDLNKWCETSYARYRLNCKAGDVCIFHGYLVHRGIDSLIPASGKPARICYAVYKKNWYNDEPEDNYVLEKYETLMK